MTVDERISHDLKQHLPDIDEAGVWEHIDTASVAARSRRRVFMAAVAGAGTFFLVVGSIGLLSRDNSITSDTRFFEAPAEQMAVIREVVAAANNRDADTFVSMFTDDGTFKPHEGWNVERVHSSDVIQAWMDNVEAWDLEADLRACQPLDPFRVECEVQTIWNMLHMEMGERWTFTFVEGQIGNFEVVRSDLDEAGRSMPLSYNDLDSWEEWLEGTNPGLAARLLPDAITTRLNVHFLRYDPAQADEIRASIAHYLTQDPSSELTTFLPDPAPVKPLEGEVIEVTPSAVHLGFGLVIQVLAHDGDRTYVLAGRVSSSADLLFSPATGVVAAFDSVGNELWRTEVDQTPDDLAADEASVWVGRSETGSVLRLDPSTGEVLGAVEPIVPAGVTGCNGPLTVSILGTGFGSLWVRLGDMSLDACSAAMARIEPDLSWTLLELDLQSSNLQVADDLAIGADAVWVGLSDQGLVWIDPITNEATTISVDRIGHDVAYVAVDGNSTFVGAGSLVSSIVDGEPRATASVGRIRYLGRISGVIGALTTSGRFNKLVVDDPMVVDVVTASTIGFSQVFESGGAAWEAANPYTYLLVELEEDP